MDEKLLTQLVTEITESKTLISVYTENQKAQNEMIQNLWNALYADGFLSRHEETNRVVKLLSDEFTSFINDRAKGCPVLLNQKKAKETQEKTEEGEMKRKKFNLSVTALVVSGVVGLSGWGALVVSLIRG